MNKRLLVLGVLKNKTIFYFEYRLIGEKRELQGVKDKLVGRLNKHKIYHKFLEKTLETADEFQEIREIIARYETLVATHTVGISTGRKYTRQKSSGTLVNVNSFHKVITLCPIL